MSGSRMVYLLGVLAFLSAAQLQAQSSDLSTAQVGDWVEYKSSTMIPNGQPIVQKTKRKVVRKTEAELVIMVEIESNGQAVTAREMTVPLNAPKQMRPEAEPAEAGEETLEIGGKQVPCSWKKYSTPGKQSTTWTSEVVPLGGLVKMEAVNSGGVKTMIELVDFGKQVAE